MNKEMGSINNGKKQQQDVKFYGKQKSRLPNYDFHSTQKGCVRNDIHFHIENWETYEANSSQIKKFYEDLEYDHSFIQWIFPNFFNSMFNSDSYRLTIEERDKMIKDQKVMEFYVKNYKMFLKFLGIQWNTNELVLENQKQFYKCLRINTHNQLRLKRVLASLSVLGQREEALKLLKLIHKEDNQLYGTEYYLYDHLMDEKQIENKENEVNQEKQLGNQQEEVNKTQKDNQKVNLSEQHKNDQIQEEKEFHSTEELQQKIESNQRGNEPISTDKNTQNEILEQSVQQSQNEQDQKVDVELSQTNQIQQAHLLQSQTKQKHDQIQEEKEILNSDELQQKMESNQRGNEPNSTNKNTQNEILKQSVQQSQIEQIQKADIVEQFQTDQIQLSHLKQSQTEQKHDQIQIEKEIPSFDKLQLKIESKQDEIKQKKNNIQTEDGFEEIKLNLTENNKTVQSKTKDLEKINKKQETPNPQVFEQKNNSNQNYYNFSYDKYQRNTKRPQFIKSKYEKFEDKFEFNEIKNNYVQGDQLNENWVKVDLLSKQQIVTQKQ
ncbi:unnamed protein product [Paramecium primaurelia]|uniref:Opioid growth factor receptor (OGFr) conserved domain-containing protein n=1 Tax=Paramecium primaurelia TaxID=5886 RepID=A0A8S1LGG4_PARPR|nr:unnamed protein product [Paramecium primaurelia]